ncbi:MAG: arsenate reductase ArsC [Tissierellia bacterium]|nr:arsenate reductase ArsC [Tissierellia bacterium]
MKKVAFVCVHNSCRSQIAEALAKKYGYGIIEAYSAGTELRNEINQDAVRLMKDMYAIDMEESQRPKLIDEIPKVDYIITMGCNVVCPTLPYEYESEDWGLEDPSGKQDEEFIKTIEEIDKKVKKLIENLK